MTQRLQQIPGVGLAAPQGAFYVMPEVSAFVGPGVEARGWGPVEDVDALCRCRTHSSPPACLARAASARSATWGLPDSPLRLPAGSSSFPSFFLVLQVPD